MNSYLPKSAALAMAAAAVAGMLLHAGTAAATAGVNAGILTCRVAPDSGVNWIVYSSADVDCVFNTPRGQERYAGRTGIGLGVNLTWNLETEIRFVVLMASSDVEIGAHALAGYYGGGRAMVSPGVSAGVAILVGGGAKSVSLQPVGVETGAGFGAAAGLSYLVLEPAP